MAAALNAGPPVDVVIAGDRVVEGNAGTSSLTFTVTLSAAAAATVTVAYASADGSATVGSDYLATSGILSFAPGETVKTITVDVLGDTAYEPDEVLTVTLASPSSNARLKTASAGGTITNDDTLPAPVTPALRIDSVSAVESAGSIRFTVSLSQAATSRVTVRFSTANGSAKAGRTGDYASTSGTLTFNPGETSKTVSVTVLEDSLVESNETLFVTLSRASGATITAARGTGTILDNDGPNGLSAATFAALAAANEDDSRRPIGV